MPLCFELRYLAIDWEHPQSVRKLEVAATPLAIERVDGEYLTETTIFKDRYAWIGIRFLGKSAAPPPALVTNAGHRPLLPITDPAGKDVWWILSDGWDSAKKRHLSELRRSAGDFVFEIDGERLRVRNLLSETSKADIQAYVDDFTGNLLWMIVNDAGGATAQSRGGLGSEGLLAALNALQEAASRVLASPAMAIRETVDDAPISKVRPTAATFRRHLAAPEARTLPGRVFHQSLDTPENRFLHHMLALSVSWTTAWLTGTSTGARFLHELSEREEARAHHNRTITHRRVDPEVFDAQTEAISARLDDLHRWREEDAPGRHGRLKITLGQPYGRSDGFFYKRADDASPDTRQEDIAYRVVYFPESVRKLVNAVLHVCKCFTFEGVGSSEIKINHSGKQYREVRLTSVSRIEAHTDVMGERSKRRERLEADEWMAVITQVDRRELEREAKVATQRAAIARRKLQSLHEATDGIARILPKLQALEHAFASKGIRRDALLPMGMLYVSNPSYAACLRSFKEVETLLQASGLNSDMLEGLQRVGVLHASDIYEKWCLLKVCMVLQEDFLFEGVSGWVEQLVGAAVSGERNVRFKFVRRDIGTEVIVAYQYETKLGVRPDILVWIRTSSIVPPEDTLASALILDAKYRTSWPPQGPRSELESLVQQKQYGASPPDRSPPFYAGVFILQPCGSTVWPPASPLDWGRNCDYGAQQKKNHRQGWIQMCAGNAQRDSVENLKRLLVMALQNALPPPKQDETEQWYGPSFCVHCGSSHDKHSIEGKKTKKGESWTFRCSACGGWSIRTHCYGCKHTLFKNGTQWTYHETLADQVTNVICPKCGAYFDRSDQPEGAP